MIDAINAIEAALPNGFHDSFLLRVTVDYVTRCAVFYVEVWTGSLESETRAEREAYRQIRLTFTGLFLCSVDAPNGEYLDASPRGLQVDAARDEQVNESDWPDEPLPPNAFRRTFYFTQDYNSCVRIAASGAALEWLTGPRAIY